MIEKRSKKCVCAIFVDDDLLVVFFFFWLMGFMNG